MKVPGYCPACGRESLFTGAGGWLTCLTSDCPDPTATSRLLQDREVHHVVVVSDTVFTVRHPLRERLDDQLERCDLHRWLSNRPGPPASSGRYRVIAPTMKSRAWSQASWVRIGDAS